MRMRDLAITAASNDAPLSPDYQRYYRLWFALGWPAFIDVLAAFYLMRREACGCRVFESPLT